MPALYNEIEPYAVAWLERLIARGLIADGAVEPRSIQDISPRDVAGATQAHFFAGIGVWSHALRLAGWPDDVPVWTGSCPCQPFSAAGKRGGFSDERHLWPDWFRLIAECCPPIVFGEQVASPDGLKWFDLVSADLESAGYTVGAANLCAAGVGAPHIRQRLYWVAHTPGQRHDRFDALLRRWRQNEDRVEVAGRGEAGGLVDTGCARGGRDTGSVLGAEGESTGEGRATRRHADELSASGSTHGFWANAEWIPCRDSKWRPIEPGTFPLAHGHSGRVVYLCPYCQQKETLDHDLRNVFKEPGWDEGRSTEEVLLPSLHESRFHQATDHSRGRTIPGTALLQGPSLRSLRCDTETAQAPQRRESHEQRCREHPSPVRRMSREQAQGRPSVVDVCGLSPKFRGRLSSQSKQDLLCAVCGRMGAYMRSTKVGLNRNGKLRAYGNAIVPQVAATFISAALEAIAAE